MIKEVKIDMKVEGLRLYIMELDPLRLPTKFGVYPYSLRTYFEFLSKNKERSQVKLNKKFYQEIVENMKAYRTDTEVSSKDLTVLFLSLIAVLMFLGLGSAIVSVIFSLSLLQGVIFLIILSIPTLYLYFAWMGTRRRNYLGKKYDENIKRAVQHLIDYGRNKIIEENLNPKDFPIKLRHNDYEGLIYEKKGKNNYVGFFKK
jgi:hypothetical protein